MMKPSLYFLTSNAGKFQEASLAVASELTLKMLRPTDEILEIQASAEKVVRHKAKQGLALCPDPFVVEDTSLHLEAWGGFPGVYVKDLLMQLPPELLAERILATGLDRAVTSCHIAHVDSERQIHIFVGSLAGRIVRPKGSLDVHGKINYNSIFQPDDSALTFAEMALEEHASKSHRAIAFRNLVRSLKAKIRN